MGGSRHEFTCRANAAELQWAGAGRKFRGIIADTHTLIKGLTGKGFIQHSYSSK